MLSYIYIYIIYITCDWYCHSGLIFFNSKCSRSLLKTGVGKTTTLNHTTSFFRDQAMWKFGFFIPHTNQYIWIFQRRTSQRDMAVGCDATEVPPNIHHVPNTCFTSVTLPAICGTWEITSQRIRRSNLPPISRDNWLNLTEKRTHVWCSKNNQRKASLFYSSLRQIDILLSHTDAIH